ncbi:RND family efflux transporter, MFP subunit [Sphingomonas sp. YR710]|uniref:efflux RND transporter periplasmic adaptor subunit n=1 Tax=Sphingomonas sp. YR710 TaxID=1882773 RepID=UPI000882D829|nr:efflux RND transporter periplasmic adaptor subunit [Sphingomonas sp. YR710]SDD81101.1 RND family efflux transporter, MFP subunit [Sphingomonas sp. YR710]
MARWTWLIAVSALLLTGCGDSAPQEREVALRPAGERLVLMPTEITDMKAVGAEITTRDSAEARARIAGTLARLSVREGDVVRKGQRIGMIVDARLGYETGAYDAQVVAAQAEAARAGLDLSRVQDLYDHKVYAKARLDQAIATARTADARLAAARAQRGASASVAGQGVVLAPSTGRVLRADIPEGSVVAPGMSIATITAGPPVLRLELPESIASQVRTGAEVLVALGDLPDGSRQGRVSQVYPAVTAGRLRLDATVPGLSTDLVGRRIGVSIAIGRRSALVVPRRFIATRYGIDQVDVLTSDGRISAVPVQIAPTADPAKAEILSGVGPGDILFLRAKGK